MAVKSHISRRTGYAVDPDNKRGLGANLLSDPKLGRQFLPAWVETHANTFDNKVPFSRSNATADHSLVADLNAVNSQAQFLTVREVAAHFQLSEKTIRRLIKAGDIPVVRLGRSVRMHPEVIEKIERQNE
jgi:excisionase family DNA binding protein